MECGSFREAISARLDSEPIGMPELVLDAHLRRCPACSAWADDAAVVTRHARLVPAPAVPDLTAAVLSALPVNVPSSVSRHRAWLVDRLLRTALLVVGLAQAALALPALELGMGSMHAPTHLAHESVAWNAAVAAALLSVAAAPRLAGGALPFLGTFAVLLTVVASADLLAGRVPVDRALGHLLLLLGVVLVALTAWRGRHRRLSGTARRVVA